MVKRPFWIRRIEQAWSSRPLCWLQGVRRSGKTSLARMLEHCEYFNCESPRTRAQMADPDGFLGRLDGKRIVLDEVHRLENPSELLKLAADGYPATRVLATGSSTLSATRKFRDTLTGRKQVVTLTPLAGEDLEGFGGDLKRRLWRGGLPGFFLSGEPLDQEYQEWMDDYWARDIQEMFRLGNRGAFLRFVELLFAQSGGLFEATRFARDCRVSHTTIANYLAVLEATGVAWVVRPYSTRKATELVAAPKVYGFDTGFAAYFRGLEAAGDPDWGALWELYTLNELKARLPGLKTRYWRDKQGHEVDFVLQGGRGAPLVAVECKWSSRAADLSNLEVFKRRYPAARCVVAAADAGRPARLGGEARAELVSLEGLVSLLEAQAGPRAALSINPPA